ncbi:MAG: thrombospondin type 3 repeat-containing protein [Deltaproteobacteria bacterium]|nr:thrombospondin type 3 repeat-containing protein [Deltaproteobacteria bacterium]
MKSLLNPKAFAVRGTAALAALAAVLAAGPAAADVVLNPGTITGTAGIGAWTQSSTYASVSGNTNGYSGSASSNGTTYSVTLEGSQTYNSIYVSLSKYTSGVSQNLYLNKSSANIQVPGGGTVNYDLTYPGGLIQPTIAVTGGQIVSNRFYASLSTTGFSASSNSSNSGAAAGALPMVAGSNIQVYSSEAVVNVYDTDGVTVLCQTTVRFDNKTGLTLADGETLSLAYDIALTPANCARGVEGELAFNNLPTGTAVSQAYVYSNGTTYKNTYVTTIPGSYSLDGLANGDYRPYADFYFNGALAGAYARSAYYSQAPATVTDTSGMINRDITLDGSLTTGSITLSGPWAGRLNSGSIYFNGNWGAYDSTTQSYGPTAGANARCQINGTTGAYSCPTFLGDWTTGQTYLSFYDSTSTLPVSAQFYVSKSEAFSLTDSSGIDLGNKEIPTSEGQIVFDVIEPPGAATIPLSSPRVDAYRYDSATGTSYSLYSNNYWAQNVGTATVRLIGAPGTYTFNAYATVAGSNTKFASSTITLGEAVDTPTGTDVAITPLDADGNESNVDLVFGEVTGGGSTTVSFADVGPGAPEGSEFVDVVTDKQYLNVTSSADFTGLVQVCLSYDPSALGLSESQEGQLQLQQYVCVTASDCSWQVITGTLDGTASPDTATNTICGLTTSLSTFAITLPTAPPDACPDDPNKTEAGICGCGVADDDTDGDGTVDCNDGCATDANKTAEGICGCGVADTDTDADGTADCNDGCATDANKTAAGQCGCGNADTDTDADGTADCNDGCATDANKTAAGQCGCGNADTDTDADGTADCNDGCVTDANKTAAGQCGCGVADTDDDNDGVANCNDNCVAVANADQFDYDGDGAGDACDDDDDNDGAPDSADSDDNNPTVCSDTDGDSCEDCVGGGYNPMADGADLDADGLCDAGDPDDDGDGTNDANDNCPVIANADQVDTDGDGQGNACDADDDNDGVLDADDSCPLSDASGVDLNGDGCIDDAAALAGICEAAAADWAAANGGCKDSDKVTAMLLGNNGGDANNGICDKIADGDFSAAMAKMPSLFDAVAKAGGKCGASDTGVIDEMLEIARVMATVAIAQAEAAANADAGDLAKATAALAAGSAATDSEDAAKAYKKAYGYAVDALGEGASGSDKSGSSSDKSGSSSDKSGSSSKSGKGKKK